MKSESVTRFAAIALSLFLSSNNEFCQNSHGAFVESFQLNPTATGRQIHGSSTSSSSRLAHRHLPTNGYGTSKSSYRSNHQRRSRSFRLQVTNSEIEEATPMGFNDTALANAESLERAWALDSADADDAVVATKSLSETMLSAEIVGPFATITVVTIFLLYCLLNSCGLSDTFESMDLSGKMSILSSVSWMPSDIGEAKVVVAFVMAFSAFAQALTGFGFAVVAVGAMSSMPWLLHSELYDVITPVAATLGALVGFILLIPYAFAEGPPTEEEPGLDWGEILPLLIPCTILTPLGIQLNSMVDPVLGTRILAGLIMGFVAYKLAPMVQDALGADGDDDAIDVTAVTSTEATDAATGTSASLVLEADAEPDFLQSRTAAILFGSAAGIFGGAFDVQGPPLCVYGDAKGWSPAKFRNNVLAVVCLNSAFVVAIDYYQGALGDFYYSYFCLTSLPGVLLGVVAGQYASERIDPVLFKNLVLVMCLGLGIQLLRVS